MATLTGTATNDWVGVKESQAITGLGYQAVHGLIASGQVTTRQIPGARVKLSRRDLERLVAESTRPARREMQVQA